MATRFIQEATNQLAPVFDQQIQAAQSQIPAIQQLYQTLTQGLQQQNQMQLDSGTQNIVEDASARGVLRSTLPVDARQSLTAQLGAALNQSLGQLGLQQTQQIGGIQDKIGSLGVSRATSIADLARSLESQDLERMKLAQDMEIARMQAAASRASKSSDPTASQNMAEALAAKTGDDGFVSPGTWNSLKNQWVAGGYGDAKQFDSAFSGFKNPRNPNYGGISRLPRGARLR